MKIYDFILNDEVVSAFNKSFQDYPLEIPKMSKLMFYDRIVNAGCCDFKSSSIAEDNGNIVGLSLCAHDIKSFVINSFGVIPEYRGRGAADALMEDSIKKSNERDIFLEVLSNNGRAIKFYKKNSFDIIKDIYYFHGHPQYRYVNNNLTFVPLSIMEILELQKYIDVDIIWQSRFRCMIKQDIAGIAAILDGEMAGFAIFTRGSYVNVKQLYVFHDMRGMKIGSSLLMACSGGLPITAIFIENGLGELFYKSLGIGEKTRLYLMKRNGGA